MNVRMPQLRRSFNRSESHWKWRFFLVSGLLFYFIIIFFFLFCRVLLRDVINIYRCDLIWWLVELCCKRNWPERWSIFIVSLLSRWRLNGAVHSIATRPILFIAIYCSLLYKFFLLFSVCLSALLSIILWPCVLFVWVATVAVHWSSAGYRFVIQLFFFFFTLL